MSMNNSMRILQRLAIAISAALALAGVVLVLWAVKFDGDWLKQELSRMVLEEKGRNLRIDGEVALSLLPEIGIRLGPAHLSERSSGQEFASIEGARLAVQLLPLFSRQVMVKRIELQGLRAKVVRYPDGTYNVADLLPGEKESRPAGWDIGEVQVTRSALTYRDEKSGLLLHLAELTLTIGQLANRAQGPVQLAAAVTYGETRAALRLEGEYQLDLDKRRYGFSRLAATLQPAIGSSELAVGLEASGLMLAGDGRIGVEKLSLGIQRRTAGGLAIEANIAGAVDGDLRGQLVRCPKLIGELAVEHPAILKGRLVIPLEASFFADLARPIAHANLVAKLDGTNLQAKGQIVALSPVKAGFDVAIDRLDLDRYFTPGTPPPPGQAREEAFSFPLGVDLDGSIQIGQLRFQKAVLEGVKADVRLRDGRLANPGAGQHG